ncbi:MAG: ABC transporter ATP-binding protein/permease [Veillonellaceae bacterium]|nr:ABC transporter ATP-binding protein/permease [Veillonellaceae bacterium]
MRRGVVLRSAWRIARAYWFSEEKWSAWLLLLTVIAFNLGLVYITVQINVWHSYFYQVIQDYNYPGFLDAVIQFAILAAIFIAVRGIQIYVRMLLHINWRRWLTDKYLSEWLRKKTYYRLQLMVGDAADNPDQRISEDIELFVALTLRLSLDLLQDVVTVSSFVVILWNLSGVIYLDFNGFTLPIYGYLVWAAFLYAGVGTYLTVKVGRPLVRLEYDQQRYEADFRYSLIRVRDNAESIALYSGETQEKANCFRHFYNIISNYRQIINIRRNLMWLTTGYSQVSVIFSILVASPRYFYSQIHLGQMFQIIDAYNHVQVGFSFIIDSFTRLAQWRAVVNRLNNFILFMETVRADNSSYQRMIDKHNINELAVDTVNVFRPDGYNLVKDITLNIKQGERILVAGPSGCGKSTLLRALAGLWPYTSGLVNIPRNADMLFVPQRTYMPIDELRKVLIYPGLKRAVSDAELIEMLKTCRLQHLTNKLDECLDWGQALSLGEQQRIAFVRTFLTQPNWLFLDEATSALDETTEEMLYSLLIKLLPKAAIISVGHRNTLVKYHVNKLRLDGNGGWQLEKHIDSRF